VKIVYDPAHPRVAALASQLRGSPWAGAPTGNLISSALLTAALLVLAWQLIKRSRPALAFVKEILTETPYSSP
jgi:hypothetical protein